MNSNITKSNINKYTFGDSDKFLSSSAKRRRGMNNKSINDKKKGQGGGGAVNKKKKNNAVKTISPEKKECNNVNNPSNKAPPPLPSSTTTLTQYYERCSGHNNNEEEVGVDNNYLEFDYNLGDDDETTIVPIRGKTWNNKDHNNKWGLTHIIAQGAALRRESAKVVGDVGTEMLSEDEVRVRRRRR